MVGDVKVHSSEAFYQAMRFPHLPDFQKQIIEMRNALHAKRFSYTAIEESRPDWKSINIAVMRHALELKFASNQEKITRLMKDTDDLPIVEISKRDAFWGANPSGELLVGENILGRLLMELRVKVLDHRPGDVIDVAAPSIEPYLLLGEPVGDLQFLPQEVEQPELF